MEYDAYDRAIDTHIKTSAPNWKTTPHPKSSKPYTEPATRRVLPMTLRNRILVSILAGVLGSIFLLGAILMVRVHKNFERYLMLEQQLQMANLVEEIQTVYLNNAPPPRAGMAEAEHIYLRLYDTGQSPAVADGIPSESTMRPL